MEGNWTGREGVQQARGEDGTDAELALERHLEAEDGVDGQGEHEDVVAEIEGAGGDDVGVVVDAGPVEQRVPDLVARDALRDLDDDGGDVVQHAEDHEGHGQPVGGATLGPRDEDALDLEEDGELGEEHAEAVEHFRVVEVLVGS